MNLHIKTKSYIYMNPFTTLRTAIAALFFSLYAVVAFAQPTVLGTQLVDGGYTTYDLNTVGAFKQIRLQATSDAVVSARNWEFATGTAGSTNYSTNWRPYTTGNTLSANTFIPTSFANGARYNTGSGGQSGLLPVITSGNYYTFNVSNNATSDNVMQLLETTYNPVTISTVAQSDGSFGSRTITIMTSGTPNASENIFVRYSTNSYVSSTLVQATGSGTTWTANIPWQASAVSLYIYTSNKTLAQIDSDVTAYGQDVHDMSTLSLNNNGGANYSWMPANSLLISAGDGGFETGATFALNGWTPVNTGTTNGSQWFITSGTITNGSYSFVPTTSRAAYISNNAGTNWRYNTSAASASSHIYKDITFPAAETAINLSFRYNVGPGEATWDEMYVYLCPQTLTPLANSPSSSTSTVSWTGTGSATLLGTFRNLTAGAGANSGSIVIPAAIAGNTMTPSNMRLVFTWKNDNSGGTEPPAALDDVSLTSAVPVPFSGTRTVGPTGNYFSLGAAFADLAGNGVNGSVTLELQSTYLSSVESFPITASAIPGSSGANTITVRPAVGATGLSITSANTTATLSLSGGSNIIFDGRPGGTGSLASTNLNIANTSVATGGTAIRFLNDATSNTVQYCNLSAAFPSTISGVINILGGTTNVTGNDNNTITLNNINGTGAATNGIYSAGTTNSNNGITISNNNIYDFFAAVTATNGISVSTGNTDWTISGNRIYQTISRSYINGTTHTGILISNTSGNNFTVSNNIIGGSSAGAALTGGPAPLASYTIAGSIANRYRGISLNVGTTTVSSVQGNTIAGFTFASSSGAFTVGGPWCGIYVNNGAVNIGNTSANTIGSGTGTGSIIPTITSTGGVSSGIFTESAAGVLNISNNVIGSITPTGSTTSISHGFTGINVATTAAVTINNNTIGSTDTANSINSITASTVTGIPTVTGILNSGASTNIQITNNTIANLNSAYVPASASSSTIIRGIVSSGGVNTITGNLVRNLSTAANATGTGSTASVIGISATSTTAGTNLTQNTIFDLSNSFAGAAQVVGIHYNGPTTGTNIVGRNLIHSLSVSNTSASVIGVNVAGGTTNFQNNMIRLGIDAAGNVQTTAFSITGISDNSGTNNYYFNSVYLGGTGVGTTATNTFAFVSAVTTNTRLFQNNIFFNARSNNTTGGSHYAISLPGTSTPITGLTCNNNVYFVNGTGGVLGRWNSANYTTLTGVGSWNAATLQDANSFFSDPQFINASGSAALVDLHIHPTNPTNAERQGVDVGVTNDYDGQTRSDLTPVDIGADAGNFVLLDVTGPTIVYTPLPNTLPGVDQTLTATITDASGVPTSGLGLPVLYYRINAGSYVAVTGTSIGSNQYTFTFGAAATMGGDLVSYYIAAQDGAIPPNVGTFPITGSAGFSSNPPAAATPPTTPSTFFASGTLSGTKTVCSSGCDYSSLTNADGAFAGINNSIVNGNVVLQLSGDLTLESGTNALNAFTSPHTLTIVPTTTVNVISIANATNLIHLNGADRVTIDGLNSGGNSLNFDNSFTGGTTFLLSNDATNNVIQNCTIKGGNTSAMSGVVVFGTGFTTGNDGNTISNNIITASGSNFPANILYSAGTSGAIDNNGNTVSGNLISDFYQSTVATAGIFLAAPGNSAWTITNNRLFQTTTRLYTTGNVHNGIFVGSGEGYTISGNTIGFANATGTGTTNMVGNSVNLTGTFPSAYTSTGTANATTYFGLNCNFTTAGAVSSIQNNTIGGFALYTGTAGSFNTGVWCGIQVLNGNVNIGTLTGNVIGATTGTSSIYAASTFDGAKVVGMNVISTNTVAIQNNIIAAIDAVGSNATNAGSFLGINCSGGSVNISNNTIGNTTPNNIRAGYTLSGGSLSNNGTTTSTAGTLSTMWGIVSEDAFTAVVNNNVLQGWQNGTTQGGWFRGIHVAANFAGGSSIVVNNNQLGTSSQGLINFLFANTYSSQQGAGIITWAAQTVTIQGNDFRGDFFTVSGTMSIAMIYAQGGEGPGGVCTVDNNTFTNLIIKSTGYLNLIGTQSYLSATATQNFTNNSIVTGLSKPLSSGNIILIQTNGFGAGNSAEGSFSNVLNNNFSNITCGCPVIRGTQFYDSFGVIGATRNISGNTFSNWNKPGIVLDVGSAGTGSQISNNTMMNIAGGTGINLGFYGGSLVTISNNVITGWTAGGFGIQSNNQSTVVNINNNTIGNFTNGDCTGIYITGGPRHNVFNNKIYDLSGTLATTRIVGISVENFQTENNIVNVYNNLIGDLKATAATNTFDPSVIGINFNSSANTNTINAYYNTIFLNASSSGTNFYTCGIFHRASSTATSTTLNLRNNIIVNTSTPNGTGYTAAFRRSVGTAGTLANYASSSNNNLFYAGVPGTNRLIYADGVSSAQTLMAYKSGVFTAGTIAPRDAASVSELPVWISTNGTSNDFLKFDTTIPTAIESGAVNIATYTDDYAGTIRFGNPGSLSTGTAPDLGAWESPGTPLPQCADTPTASTITGGISPICNGYSGGTLALSPTYYDLGITYQWKSGTSSGGPYNTTLGTEPNQVVGNLTQTTYFICEITCTNSGMTFTTAEKSIVVNDLPTVTVSPTSGTFCTPGGTPITLTANGASTYTWAGTGTPGLSATSGNPITASPTTNTTITVTGTDSNGCINTATAIITSLAAPVTPTTSPYSICIGETVPGGQGITSSFPTVTATQTINFTVAGQPTETNSAPGNVVASATMTALPAGSTVTGITINYPNLTALSSSWRSDIRLGLSGALINAAAQGTGAQGSAGTFNYTRTATSGITGSPLVGGTVNLLYWDNFNDNAGAEATFPTGSEVASLMVSYSYPDPSSVSWFTTAMGGTALGAGTPFNPVGVDPALPNTNTAGNYTYFAQVSNGTCPSTRSAAVFTVSTGAAVTTNPAPASACVGANASFTVVATGPDLSYIWELSTDNGGSWNPVVNGGVYSNATTATLNLTGVTGLMNNYQYRVNVTATCGSPVTSAVATLTVTSPLAGINPSATIICVGESVTLTENGGTATSWSWTPGEATSQAITVSPATTTTYTVTATVNGCSANAQQTITVNPLPSMVTITPPSATICQGSSIELNASGGNVGASGTLGTGTSSTVASTSASTLGPNPFQSFYGGAKQQIIVLASELTSLGLTANSGISSIAFNLSAVESRTLQNYVVKMQHTSLSAFTSTSFVMTGFTTVRNAANLTPVSGWNTITLNTPFTWNGTSNLLIEVNFSNNDAGGTGSNRAVFSTTTGFASSLFYRVDNQTPAAVDAATTASFAAYTQRNNIQFVFTGTPANFTWSPADGLNTTTGPTVTASPAMTTMYTATSTINGCSTSNTVNVAISPNAAITSVTGTTPLCINATATYTANGVELGGGTGAWSSDDTNVATVDNNGLVTAVAAGTANIIYTITGGCGGTVYAQQNVSVSQNYTIMASSGLNGTVTPTGTTTLCSGGNQTYTITPDMGYVIADVLVDGNSVGAVASYTFTNVTSNRTISAAFIQDCLAPSISSLNPIPINRAGGQVLTISGNNFSATGNTVTIGGILVSVNFESTSSITITTPANLCNGIITVTNGCGQISNSFAYTVQEPLISDINPSLIMEGISITINGSNFGASGNSVTIGGIAMTTLTFQSNTQIVGIIPAGIPCTGNVVVTICGQSSNGVAYTSPNPGLTPGTSPAVCSGVTTANLTYSLPTGGPNQYSLDFDVLAEAQGFADVAYTSLPPSQIVISVPGGATPDTYEATLRVRNVQGCESTLYNITVIVNPLPTVTFTGTLANLCVSSTMYELTGGMPAGGMYSGPGVTGTNFNASVAGSNTHTLQYSYTDVNGCSNAATNSIIVLALPPAPTGDAVQEFCHNDPRRVENLTATGSNILWYANETGGNPLGNATSLVNGQDYFASQTVNGCESSDRFEVIVVIYARPTIEIDVNQPHVCLDATMVEMNFTTENGADTYSMDFDPVAEAAGFVDIVNAPLGASPLQVVIPVDAPAALVPYSATVMVSNSITGCSNTTGPSYFYFFIDPDQTAGTMIIGPNSLCIGDIATYYPNAEFPLGQGLFSTSNPTIATINPTTGELTSLTDGPVSVIYTMSVGCGPVSSVSKNITVRPDNTAGMASDQPTVCVNTLLPSITHTTTGATGRSNSMTGLPAGVTSSWSANVLTISGTPSLSGNFNYQILLTGGCGTAYATGTITVQPQNTVSPASSSPILCINTMLPDITHNTTLATGIGTPTGLPAGVMAVWANDVITISGTPSEEGTFIYSIPLTGGCGSINATGTIIVNSLNTVSPPSSSPVYCINTAITIVTHTTTGATGIGTATGLPGGVNASWAGNTITISGTPIMNGIFNYSIPLTGGCGIVSASGSISSESIAPTITCPANVTINNISGQCAGSADLLPPVATDNCNIILKNALNFDGINDFVSLDNTIGNFGTENFSIELWLKVPDVTGPREQIILSKRVGCISSSMWNLQIDEMGRFSIEALGEGNIGSVNATTTQTNFDDDKWHHVVWTRNGLDHILYVDGSLLLTANSVQLGSYVNTAYLHIGKSDCSDIDESWAASYFKGTMDELRIWNIARTETEIRNDMFSELNSQPNLIALHHFNHGNYNRNNTATPGPVINISNDASGNNYHGTLNDFTLNGMTSNWIGGFWGSLFNNAPDLYPLGQTQVTWLATDQSGNTNTCSQLVVVNDNQNPVAVCPTTPPTVTLDNDGNATLPLNALAGGNSTDNCSQTETSPVTNFACLQIGVQSVILTATDGSGNINTTLCSVNVLSPSCPDVQTRTWTGGVSTSWNNPCNWSPICVPQTLTPVIVSNLGFGIEIETGQNITVKSVELQPGSSLLLQPNSFLNVDE